MLSKYKNLKIKWQKVTHNIGWNELDVCEQHQLFDLIDGNNIINDIVDAWVLIFLDQLLTQTKIAFNMKCNKVDLMSTVTIIATLKKK